MATSRVNKLWSFVIFLLLVIIATGSIVTCSRYQHSQPLEITTAPESEFSGEVYIGGEVANPGFYPLKPEDRMEDIIKGAGGRTDNAQPGELRLYVVDTEEEKSQKININRAEAWLLEALPGIGETRARDIIEYRQKNGRFSSTGELMKVEGIGAATYEKIKHLITVAD